MLNAAGDHHDGRSAGLGQDDDDRQDRQAAEGKAAQEGDDGVARRQSPGGAGTAGGAGRRRSMCDLPIVAGQQPVDIARRALQAAKLQGFDVLLLDTAGRLHVDQAADGRDEGGCRFRHARRKRCSSSIR
jgi:hypothetical protein